MARMKRRWPRFLPRFPALLLVPTVLGAWVPLCFAFPHPYRFRDAIGFPLHFKIGNWWRYESGWHSPGAFEFYPVRLTVDIGVALATAYAAAMTLDRLVFPLLRGRRRQK